MNVYTFSCKKSKISLIVVIACFQHDEKETKSIPLAIPGGAATKMHAMVCVEKSPDDFFCLCKFIFCILSCTFPHCCIHFDARKPSFCHSKTAYYNGADLHAAWC